MKNFYKSLLSRSSSILGQCTPMRITDLNQHLALLSRSCRYREALDFFIIIHSGLFHHRPDAYTLSTILSASSNLRQYSFGNQLHVLAIKSGLNSSIHVVNALLAFYGKTLDLGSLKQVFEEIHEPDAFSYSTLLSCCMKMGDVINAFKVFDDMPHRDISAWNCMVAGCLISGNVVLALSLFRDICRTGIMYDNYTLSNVLRGCAPGWMEFSLQIHSLVIKTGFSCSTSVFNSLLTIYAENNDLESAKLVFNEVKSSIRSVVTYNVMMNGFASMGRIQETQLLFKEMVRSEIEPNVPSFVIILSSCLDVVFGNQLHSYVEKMGFDCVTQVSNAAITMYSNCGAYDNCVKIFRSLKEKDVVSWNALLSCYSQANLENSVLLTFKEMLKGMIKPDEFSIGSLLSCAGISEIVAILHSFAMKCGLISYFPVVNSLITAYSNHGKMNDAHAVFSNAEGRNLITWNALVCGFVNNGFPKEGMKLLHELSSYIEPNELSLNSALSICCATSASTLGKQIHCRVLFCGYFENIRIGNGLISFYSKTGDLECCVRIFNSMRCKDVVTWNAMISAYAQHGEGLKAVRCFEAMNVRHDEVTLRAVLWACCNAGLVVEGKRIFKAILAPQAEQIAAIVSLLVRGGHLDDVEEVVKGGPELWWAALSSCTANCDMEVVRIVRGLVVEMGRKRELPSVQVALANAYASAGQWADAARTRLLLDPMNVKKQTALCWIACN